MRNPSMSVRYVRHVCGMPVRHETRASIGMCGMCGIFARVTREQKHIATRAQLPRVRGKHAAHTAHTAHPYVCAGLRRAPCLPHAAHIPHTPLFQKKEEEVKEASTEFVFLSGMADPLRGCGDDRRYSVSQAGQTRRMSALESITNVAIGYGIAVAVQAAVFPLFGLHASAGQHFSIAAIFTAVSIVRSYALRRLFNRVGVVQ